MKQLTGTIKSWLPKVNPFGGPDTLEAWEKIRAKGQARFVVGSAVSLTAVGYGIAHAIQNIFFQPEEISLAKFILYLLLALFFANSAWRKRESKYQKALHEVRTKALSNQGLAK